ncbi:MAG: hypothetical protein KME07_12735 [Pegethrix bostrychoides GSE-TBD4-15B]|jgi:hypothetical protein|uniref:Actin-like protein N-terminal domain-containing protein n=1 Tax=Pegethrix bostrychoides GSE-TBD4-15B TaxID=2839662 RepID=A0A951PDA1_9CYAN|nr:hypothetical protein [Pegethrix bostrychoides GSE-TBD4-15B]
MNMTATAPPTVSLAADLGTSASKFFYRVTPSQTVPFWMGAEVAQGLSTAILPNLNIGGRPQDSAWLQMGDEVVLVGEVAKTCLDSNSFAANKADKAAYKLAAALGVIAEIEHLPSEHEANIWVPLPLTEIRTRDEIAVKLTAIAKQGFLFRGKPQQVKLSLKFFPEGFGLYLNRKKQLEILGLVVEQRRTLIAMLGHRNLSILCFEGGSLKTAQSNSDGPGFWGAFEKAARSQGVTPADYTALLTALTTGQTQQISQVRAGLYDFAQLAEIVRQTYWQAVLVYLQDNLLGQLTERSVDIIISGGAAHVLRPTISQYFEQLGLSKQLMFADGMQERLLEVVSQLPEASSNPSLPLRMADCYGLFQGLMGKSSKIAL